MRKYRLSAGAVALATGLWFLTAATAAPPALPKEAYKKAVAADTAFIIDALKGGSPDKRAELEKEVLTQVARGLVGRLAQIVRAQSAKERK